MLSPYLLRFLSRSTKTGEYKKSEDGEFLAIGGPLFILLTPRSCDLYRITNFYVNYIMKHLMCPFMVSLDGLQKTCGAKRTVV